MDKIIIVGAGPCTGCGKFQHIVEFMQAAGSEVVYMDLEAYPLRGLVSTDLSKLEEKVLGQWRKDPAFIDYTYLRMPVNEPADKRKGPKGPRGKWGKLK